MFLWEQGWQQGEAREVPRTQSLRRQFPAFPLLLAPDQQFSKEKKSAPWRSLWLISRCVVFDCHDDLGALQVWAGVLPHPTHLRPEQFSNVLSDIQVSTNPDLNTLNLDS